MVEVSANYVLSKVDITNKLFAVFVTDFEGIALGSTSIYLSWSSIAFPGSYHFKIRVDELESAHTWIFYSVETHATILSLHPYYHYICEVAIVTDITYPYSPAITVITLQSGEAIPKTLIN